MRNGILQNFEKKKLVVSSMIFPKKKERKIFQKFLKFSHQVSIHCSSKNCFMEVGGGDKVAHESN